MFIQGAMFIVFAKCPRGGTFIPDFRVGVRVRSESAQKQLSLVLNPIYFLVK